MSEPTYEELKARLAELEKQGPKRTGSLEFRVSEKGGVSVYGLGRFPVTLYYEQWTRLLDATEKLREFIEDNKSKLKLKDRVTENKELRTEDRVVNTSRSSKTLTPNASRRHPDSTCAAGRRSFVLRV